MKRECDFNEISDGKLYKSCDMAKLGCNDCRGCSSCCRGVGNTIVLDPFDVYRMDGGIDIAINELFDKHLIMSVIDGLILPSLKMSEDEDKCTFLNNEGRCSIHSVRPGICRLFPLGRIYEDGSFNYFLQVDECKIKNRSKVKISKWLDTPNLPRYEKYINDWHYFIKDTQNELLNYDDTVRKNMSMYILKTFYLTPYTRDKFYEEFYERLEKTKAMF